MSNDISDKTSFRADVEADGSDKDTKTRADFAEEHAHLSLGDVLRGTAVHESTPFERKAALINA